MRLKDMSGEYRKAAEPIRRELRRLRQELKTEAEPERRWQIKQRMAELTPVLTQINELAELTAHYYDRGYYRGTKYTF